MDISEIFDLIKKEEQAETPPKEAKKRRGPKDLSEEKLARLREQLRKGRETAMANRKALAVERQKMKEEANSDKLGVRIQRERAKIGLNPTSSSEMLSLLRRMVDAEDALKAIKTKSDAPKDPEPTKPLDPVEPAKPPEPVKSIEPVEKPIELAEKPFDYSKLHKFAKRMRNNRLGGMGW